MRLAGQGPVPAHAMIRPRAGDFAFDAADAAQMESDIAAARAAGLAGVVLGAARDGRLDVPLLARLIRAAEGMEATLHRVIDTLSDPVAAVDQAVALGFERILTSGGAATAPQGQAVIRAMLHAAAGRIAIMAGSGVTPAAVPELAALGVRDFHASCAAPVANEAASVALGFGQPYRRDTDARTTRNLRAALTAQAVRMQAET